MVEKQGDEKLTFSEAMNLIKEASNKGYGQGVDFSRSRDAQRVIIAYRIKTERAAKGISQEKLSEMINTNPLTYRGYENCKSDIPIVFLVRIADILEVSLDYLTGRTDEKTETQKSLEERVKKLEKLLLKEE